MCTCWHVVICVSCLFLAVVWVRLCRETGLSPPVKYFTDRSKAVLLLWIIGVFLILSGLFITALWSPAGKGQTTWLLLVMLTVFLLLAHVVSWVRCGT